MSDDERKRYNYDGTAYLLPDYFSNSDDRFHLFRYEKDALSNIKEWEKLMKIEEYYKTNKFSYKILENNGIYYYTEYCNDEEVTNITFGEPEYGYILKTVEQKVCDFNELYSDMSKEFSNITEERLKEILTNLKKSYLIYFNTEFSNIISVIEINQ